MKIAIRAIVILVLAYGGICGNAGAQTPFIIEGIPDDSVVFSFGYGEPLSKPPSIIDTTGCQIWQIGGTTKPFFAGGPGSRAIMTDTALPYPPNTDESFVLHVGYAFNEIVTFRHKFQTDSGKDGGVVEFSNDNGQTWENVLGLCHKTQSTGPGIYTTGFYTAADTLSGGRAAFSGSSDWRTSRVQFFTAIPLKGTAGCSFGSPIRVRFRFISDANASSADGWIISEIKVEQDNFGSGFYSSTFNELAIRPNPSADGCFEFPDLTDGSSYRISIFNSTGLRVMEADYARKIQLSSQPDGLYFYTVSDGSHTYRGKLLKGR